MSRLFVAAWPPPSVVSDLTVLPRSDEPGVRWTTADQWHVTLRFLGEVDENVAATVLAGCDASATRAVVGPHVDRLGRDVIVAPVSGLDDLAAAVRAATAAVGEPVDPRPFVGHLTLARVRGGGTCALAGHPFRASFPVEELALVRSERRADGARYTTVATYPLRA